MGKASLCDCIPPWGFTARLQPPPEHTASECSRSTALLPTNTSPARTRQTYTNPLLQPITRNWGEASAAGRQPCAHPAPQCPRPPRVRGRAPPAHPSSLLRDLTRHPRAFIRRQAAFVCRCASGPDSLSTVFQKRCGRVFVYQSLCVSVQPCTAIRSQASSICFEV